MADEILQSLCSATKLERDRGSEALEKYVKEAPAIEVIKLEQSIQNILSDSSIEWETKHGALMGMRLLVTQQSKPCSDEFAVFVKDHSLKLLDDAESRVRLAAGEVMGALCKRIGPSIYVAIKDKLLESIKENLERQPLSDAGIKEQEQAEKLMAKLSTERKRRGSTDSEQIFHDTAGWKSLETWMKCLQAVINGCGPLFNTYIDQELLDLIFDTLTHTNRFVRETGYYVCGSLVSCNFSEENQEVTCMAEDNAIYRHGNQFAEHLSRGLADNWSQVRLASSVATRKFLLSLPDEDVRHTFYPQILPPLCLNRYYVAEGVRIYNQETWKLVAGGDGKTLVETFIKEVVNFYISQTEADNHAVREAACACIAELGSKIDNDVARPFVPQLLDALLVCFKDESWPVRDASCVACGNFVLCYPVESQGTMSQLYPLFFENLQDNIPSVRQGAAMALANVVKAYGKEAITTVIAKIKEGLIGLEKQEAGSEKYGSMDKGPATYGVVKRLRDNDVDLHTNQQMYSCGSLAPKMHRGARGGGCMDHQFRRPPEPWELADGCVDLMAELSKNQDFSKNVAEQLETLAQATSHRHYPQHVNFLETVCKQIPVIAKGIGKKVFKMYLEMFLDAIFYSFSCDNALTSAAASHCLSELSKLLGPNILKGRVEQYNPRYLEQLEMALIGPGMEGGPDMGMSAFASGIPIGPGMPGPPGGMTYVRRSSFGRESPVFGSSPPTFGAGPLAFGNKPT